MMMREGGLGRLVDGVADVGGVAGQGNSTSAVREVDAAGDEASAIGADATGIDADAETRRRLRNRRKRTLKARARAREHERRQSAANDEEAGGAAARSQDATPTPLRPLLPSAFEQVIRKARHTARRARKRLTSLASEGSAHSTALQPLSHSPVHSSPPKSRADSFASRAESVGAGGSADADVVGGGSSGSVGLTPARPGGGSAADVLSARKSWNVPSGGQARARAIAHLRRASLTESAAVAGAGDTAANQLAPPNVPPPSTLLVPATAVVCNCCGDDEAPPPCVAIHDAIELAFRAHVRPHIEAVLRRRPPSTARSAPATAD